MIERLPPKLALWCLKHWGSTYHGESLAGDLIEQCREGRGGAWCWQQVIVAILLARGRAVRAMPWAAAGRVMSRVLAELAVVLALVVVVAQIRRTHSLAQMMTGTFVGTVAVLSCIAVAALLLSMRANKHVRAHAAVNALMLIFAVIALGLGTLTWADTLRGDTQHQAPACVSPGNRSP